MVLLTGCTFRFVDREDLAEFNFYVSVAHEYNRLRELSVVRFVLNLPLATQSFTSLFFSLVLMKRKNL